MSRAIKFRAWNPRKARMVTQGFKLHCTGEIYSDSAFVMAGDPVMQFTGLTDCYGYEIYDGDIVRDTANQGTVSKVCWGSTGWQMDPCPEARDLGELAERDRLEVIGNIYQDAGLLSPTRWQQDCDTLKSLSE